VAYRGVAGDEVLLNDGVDLRRDEPAEHATVILVRKLTEAHVAVVDDVCAHELLHRDDRNVSNVGDAQGNGVARRAAERRVVYGLTSSGAQRVERVAV